MICGICEDLRATLLLSSATVDLPTVNLFKLSSNLSIDLWGRLGVLFTDF